MASTVNTTLPLTLEDWLRMTGHEELARDDTRRLTAAIAAGDTDAFGTLYDRWFDRCLALARRLTGRDESFCLDVVQDAMMRVIRARRVIDNEAQLSVWLMRIVHTTALDTLRRDARRLTRERRRTSRPGGASTPEATAETQERIQWLRDQLASLDAEETGLLTMRFGKGTTLTRLGETTGTGKDAAHGRVRRTLDKLRFRAKEMLR